MSPAVPWWGTPLTMMHPPGQLTGMPDSSAPSPLDAVARGGKAALARALAALERAPESAETLTLLDAAYAAPRAQVLGLTGPPGVGKSTLTGRLVTAFRSRGETVGVIAVDPSSRRSGGALLGDRMRLLTDPEDAGVFVRSMAARDRLGGLADITVAAMALMRACSTRYLSRPSGSASRRPTWRWRPIR